jgi:UDP-glucose 4-epimerase
VLTKLEQLTDKVIRFAPIDITDQEKLNGCFEERGPFDLVVHCAAKKSVPESCSNPFEYYDTNITGTVNLLRVMEQHGCKNIMFSSSGSVYDTSKGLAPFVETDVLDSSNPYSNTKLIMERILKDVSIRKGFNCIVFRYFNPIGAHHSGLIGELPL